MKKKKENESYSLWVGLLVWCIFHKDIIICCVSLLVIFIRAIYLVRLGLDASGEYITDIAIFLLGVIIAKMIMEEIG